MNFKLIISIVILFRGYSFSERAPGSATGYHIQIIKIMLRFSVHLKGKFLSLQLLPIQTVFKNILIKRAKTFSPITF